MKDVKKAQFTPDFVQPPGAYLREVLEERAIRPTDFAVRCARPQKTISEILSAKASITSDTALQFERVLGDIPARLWLEREARYQLHAAREREREGLQLRKDWAKCFPIREMMEKGYIPTVKDPVEQVGALLTFFGVGSVMGWQGYWEEKVMAARFKQSGGQQVDKYAVSAWLRRGDVAAAEIECEPYDESRFKQALQHLRKLSMRPWAHVRDEVVATLARAGAAIAFVPDLHKLNLRGAAYWVARDKAVIIVSDRMKLERRFWFALFHEAMHVLLHSKKALFLDYNHRDVADNGEEKQADEAAANLLVPQQALQEFFRRYGSTRDSYSLITIKAYAKEIQVGAGLLLARLQREGFISYQSALNREFPERVEF
jgi:Zn-dependent peptidase ImmA (M78 family)/plasmid maintenance system antidote protein VapI